MKKSIIALIVIILLGGIGFASYKFLPLAYRTTGPNTNNLPSFATSSETQTNNNVEYAIDPKDNREVITGVVWQDPVKIASLPIFDEAKNQGLYANNQSNTTFYAVGRVASGKYSGSDILRITLKEIYNGVMPSPEGDFDYLLAIKNGAGNYDSFKLIVYDVSSTISQGGTPYNSSVSLVAAKFSDLEMPQTISAYGTDFDYQGTYGLWIDSSNLLVAEGITPYGPIYYTKDGSVPPDFNSKIGFGNGSFVVKTKDNRVAFYNLSDLDKVARKTDSNTGITLDNPDPSFQNLGGYTYVQHGGCGARNIANVVSVPDSSLVVIGHANFDGTPIYTLINQNDPMIKKIYDDQFSTDYSGNMERIPYDLFLKETPVFFWKDKFGRLIKFSSEKFIPAAECGKPVIYLYPTSTTTVSVKIVPQGGFTKTEPSYGDGWNVTATPESNLTNIADGKTYPYLFWEGRGGLYQAPERGWVIEKEKVSNFLDKTLSEYGLNKKEIADFKEFWLPRMQSKPYYFISFYDNKVMDELAPLSISPKPDSIIRVLMDFKGLEKPIQVESYNIPKRLRNGFTVVEWGGVLQ